MEGGVIWLRGGQFCEFKGDFGVWGSVLVFPGCFCLGVTLCMGELVLWRPCGILVRQTWCGGGVEALVGSSGSSRWYVEELARLE